VKKSQSFDESEEDKEPDEDEHENFDESNKDKEEDKPEKKKPKIGKILTRITSI
jgi:hypothetical protein